MGDFTQKLTIQAEALGLPEAARGLEFVALAQERLVEVNQKLEQARMTGTIDDVEQLLSHKQKLERAIESMTDKQDKENKAQANFGEQLRRIHPLLGDIVSVFGKYGGAASVAGAAIASFTAAVRVMRDELQKAHAAINANADAMNKIKSQSRSDQQEIEDIRSGSKLGPFKTP